MMWISKKKWEAMEKRMADLELALRGQPESDETKNLVRYIPSLPKGNSSDLIKEYSQRFEETFGSSAD